MKTDESSPSDEEEKNITKAGDHQSRNNSSNQRGSGVFLPSIISRWRSQRVDKSTSETRELKLASQAVTPCDGTGGASQRTPCYEYCEGRSTRVNGNVQQQSGPESRRPSAEAGVGWEPRSAESIKSSIPGDEASRPTRIRRSAPPASLAEEERLSQSIPVERGFRARSVRDDDIARVVLVA